MGPYCVTEQTDHFLNAAIMLIIVTYYDLNNNSSKTKRAYFKIHIRIENHTS